jgi:hypothetical protein
MLAFDVDEYVLWFMRNTGSIFLVLIYLLWHRSGFYILTHFMYNYRETTPQKALT